MRLDRAELSSHSASLEVARCTSMLLGCEACANEVEEVALADLAFKEEVRASELVSTLKTRQLVRTLHSIGR